MISNIFKYSLTFIIVVLIQLLLCNNIQFSGYINPYIYIFLILMLPYETKSWLLLVLAFILGMTIDIFTGTVGLHTFATVFAAFIRPGILRLTAPRDGYDTLYGLSMSTYGLNWYLVYASITVFAHHFVLFYLEVFRFDNFFGTLLRVILSSIFSLAFILLLELTRKGK